MIEAARGASAHIVEEGRAAATAMDRLSETWEQAGGAARQILVAQKLVPLVGALVAGVRDLKVERLSVIGVDGVAPRAAVLSEQLKQATGVDLPAVLKRLGAA
jgi:flotillin